MSNIVRIDQILPKVSKPGRYTGHEWNTITKDWDTTDVRVALAYPDTYEVGMSNLGMQILYFGVNGHPRALAERVFAPWIDMEAQMRAAGVPLFGWESRHPVADFDIVGFSLPYELNYTNALTMLDLAGIPILAAERDDRHPLIIVGGSAGYNPEPMADFIDCFVIGDGEEAIMDVVEAYLQQPLNRQGAPAGRRSDRESLLRALATIPGLYVPSLYSVSYHPDGRIEQIRPSSANAPATIERRIVEPLPPALTRQIVPFVETVHQRAVIEIQRGCTRGCRFCQAGTIYRPVRERTPEEILDAADELLKNTGFEELSLVSLSSSDYPEIERVITELTRRHPDVNISLPSLRIDAFSVDLAKSIQRRKTGLTFAPEAGTQRLRDVINKGVNEQDLLHAAEAAYSQGWNSIKLYFMLGLPTETLEDVEGIAHLVKEVLAVGRRERGPRAQVGVSLATFIPKPQTPFQWMPQESMDSIRPKQEYLQQALRRVHMTWHDPRTSWLEAALSRGDRRLGAVILKAWQQGAKFDAWTEQLKEDAWKTAFSECGLDPDFYSKRARPLDEVFPWQHIGSGVTPQFMLNELNCAIAAQTTPDCRTGRCAGCGLQRTTTCKTRRGGLV
jgi:radical SAM family uncharacterized protein